MVIDPNLTYICDAGKYKGKKIKVKQMHINHTPTAYTVEVLSKGIEIVLYEHEIVPLVPW